MKPCAHQHAKKLKLASSYTPKKYMTIYIYIIYTEEFLTQWEYGIYLAKNNNLRKCSQALGEY